MNILKLLFFVVAISGGAAQAADSENRDVCDSIPSDCIINGQVDKECICKTWCAALCGGAACNCDILPFAKNGSAPKKLVNEKACQERLDDMLSKQKNTDK